MEVATTRPSLVRLTYSTASTPLAAHWRSHPPAYHRHIRVTLSLPFSLPTSPCPWRWQFGGEGTVREQCTRCTSTTVSALHAAGYRLCCSCGLPLHSRVGRGCRPRCTLRTTTRLWSPTVIWTCARGSAAHCTRARRPRQHAHVHLHDTESSLQCILGQEYWRIASLAPQPPGDLHCLRAPSLTLTNACRLRRLVCGSSKNYTPSARSGRR